MDGTEFATLVRTGWQNIRVNEDVINELNVFPVPDGDTGSNMRITVENGVLTADSTDDLGVYAQRLARGMLLGARGNSGVIFSQIFKGIAQALKGKKTADVREMAQALVRGYEAAYHAVVTPTEGTMLTVAREGIENILDKITDDMTMDDLFRMYLAEMKRSLVRTPDMLEVLKQAGVVDSGGMGLVSFFEGFVKKDRMIEGTRMYIAEHTDGRCIFAAGEGKGFCVEFALKLPDAKQDFDILALTTYLENNGRHVIVQNENGLYRAHVHVDNPIELLRTAMEYGEYVSFSLDNLELSYNTEGQFLVRRKAHKRVHKSIGYVAVAQGEGIIRALEDFGCDIVIDGGQMMNTSVEEFLDAFEEIDADDIIVMPNNANIRLAALQAKEMCEMRDHIHVLNTKSVAEGYFAMSMAVAKADISAQIESMQTGMENVQTLLITQAMKDSEIFGVACNAGDYICITEGTISVADPDRTQAVLRGIGGIEDLEEKEAILLIHGQNVPEEDCEQLVEALYDAFPLLEVGVINGGQDIYDFVIGVTGS